jgi:hypothetical protein
VEEKQHSHPVGKERMAYPPPPESECYAVLGIRLQRHKTDRFWGRMSFSLAIPVPGVEQISVQRWVSSVPVVFN